MGEGTTIEWATHTFNIAWGCTKVSPACEHCYAEAWARRYGVGWGPNAERKTFGAKHWAAPLKWDRAAEKAGERHRVFCSSMADVFEDHPVIEAEREKLWGLIEATPHLDWLLLTKRIERWCRCWPLEPVPGHIRQNEGDGKRWVKFPNVWLGTTVENQRYADERIPHLLQTPAAVRFLSVEPLLGPIHLPMDHCNPACPGDPSACLVGGPCGCELDWVIVGGESGPGARPMNPDWARSIRDQCVAAGVPFLFKQWGEWIPFSQLPEGWSRSTEKLHAWGNDGVSYRVGKKVSGRFLDGCEWNEFPKSLAKAPAAESPT